MRRLGGFVLDSSLPISVVHCDTMSVIMQLQKRDLLARARHISKHLGFVHDATDDCDIAARHIRTMQNPTELLTAQRNYTPKPRNSRNEPSGPSSEPPGFPRQRFLLSELRLTVRHVNISLLVWGVLASGLIGGLGSTTST